MSSVVLTVISGVEAADVADAAHPLVHLVLGVGHQVEDTVDGLDVEDKAVFQVLLVEGQPSVHLKEPSTVISICMEPGLESRRPTLVESKSSPKTKSSQVPVKNKSKVFF